MRSYPFFILVLLRKFAVCGNRMIQSPIGNDGLCGCKGKGSLTCLLSQQCFLIFCLGFRTCLLCELHFGKRSVKLNGFADDTRRSIEYCSDCSLCIDPGVPDGHTSIRRVYQCNVSGHTVLDISWYAHGTGTCSGSLCRGPAVTAKLSAAGRNTPSVDEEIWVDLQAAFEFRGVTVMPGLVTSTEEQRLLEAIEDAGWKQSQSGRRKQEYGPRVNFKAQTVRLDEAEEPGAARAAPLLQLVLSALQRCGSGAPATASGPLAGFEPAEVSVLEYDPARGAAIEPHVDDAWVWGERIAGLSLAADAVMTFSERSGRTVRVLLPRRSLMIMQVPPSPPGKPRRRRVPDPAAAHRRGSRATAGSDEKT